MILQEIAKKTQDRIREEKEKIPLAKLRARARECDIKTGFPFEEALRKPGIRFICEAKRASPSKGVIAQDFPYMESERD